jgi:hypothetical protein
MNDINYIKLDLSGGWLEMLIEAIEFNREHNLKDVSARNNGIIEKIQKYKYSDGYTRIFRSEYESIFWILLENQLFMQK